MIEQIVPFSEDLSAMREIAGKNVGSAPSDRIEKLCMT
jgi:hypothetical protein